MKKLFSVLVLLAVATVQVCAQDVVGKWQSKVAAKEIDNAVVLYTLNGDKSCNLSVNADVAKDGKNSTVVFKVSFSVDGKYEVKDGKLNLDYNMESVKTDFDFDVKGDNLDEDKVKMLRPLLKQAIEAKKDEMVSRLTESYRQSSFKILSADKKQLKLESSDGEPYVFDKVK